VETPEQLEHKLKKLKIQQQEEIEGKNKIEEVEKIRKELELNCIIVDNNYYYFRRCENNEVICYIHYDGISCNLKGGNK
jgi:hypothetical protein